MTEPKELPFVAYQHEVKAILKNGRVQFRRVMRPQPSPGWKPFGSYGEVHKMVNGEPDPDRVIGWGPCNCDGDEAYCSPYGQPGDRLWVRETWGCPLWMPSMQKLKEAHEGGAHLIYKATPHEKWKPVGIFEGKTWAESWLWRPSIHMPRWASRINLQVVDIKAEPIQQILTRVKETGSFDELFLAGMSQFASWDGKGNIPTPLSEFIPIWNKHNAGYSWEFNPWVWVGEAILIK